MQQKYQFAVIATDVVIFTIRNDELSVLLIHMKKQPFTEMWAAPGGLVKPSESLDTAAKRHLLVKTGVQLPYLEQLYTFGRVDRDPFGRVVSVAYFALVPSDVLRLKTTREYSDVRWFPVARLPKLAYDHKEIITAAVERLQAKLGYTNIVYSLLPALFTLTELQNTYQTILRKKLDKRNFRKKVLSLGLVEKTVRKQEKVANRPATLYRFTAKVPKVVAIL